MSIQSQINQTLGMGFGVAAAKTAFDKAEASKAEKIYKDTLNLIPKLFSVEFSLNNGEAFFKMLKKVIDFEDCYVFRVKECGEDDSQ